MVRGDGHHRAAVARHPRNQPRQPQPIHILSVVTLIGVPRLVLAARQHRIADHRRGVRVIVSLALLVVGLFTFPFGRILGQWLFG